MKVYRDPLLKMEKNPGGDCLTVTGKGDRWPKQSMGIQIFQFQYDTASDAAPCN